MFKDNDPIATVAVKDLERARKFYEDKLDLEQENSSQAAITDKCGNSKLMIYRSEYAGTNKATSAALIVGDEIEEIVRNLRDKGVTFEHYNNLPDTTLEGDIHIAEGAKLAWFKDPDGNIFHLFGG